MPSSRLIIDCEALERRFWELDRTIMPMVKANGYGLGIFELASFYERLGVPFVGVSYAQEGVALRERGYCSPIFVLTCSDPKLASAYDLTVALNSLEEAKKLHSVGKKVDVHLQLDLGLNRFGFSTEEAYAALPFIHKSPYLNLEGVLCHLGRAENEVSEFEAFAKSVNPKWIHMASSKSLHLDPPICNMVRLGLSLLCGLTLESYVVALHCCKKGDPLGYRGELAVRDCELAVLSIGYHDGLHLGYRGHVDFDGRKAPYVSNIYMDFLMVDVTGLGVQVGDRAEIFGPNVSLEELVGTINPRQLLCCLGPRVKREYVNVREGLGTGKAHRQV